MEYVYAAMLLHKAQKPITEEAVTKILQSAGIEVNDAKVKALVAALDGVDIEEAINKAAVTAVAAAPAAGASAPADAGEAKAEEKKEEKKEDDGAAAAGLGALFG